MNVLNQQAKKGKIVIPLVLIAIGAMIVFRHQLMGLVSRANLEVKIEHPPVIMPAVYKVYENEDALEGKYNLFKMLVTNTSNSTARNVDVSFEIPGYIEQKSVRKIPVILPGQSVIVNCYPAFEQKIVEKMTPSREKINIRITGSNIDEREESFPIEVKGRNEFMYTFIPSDEIRTRGEYFDNIPLIAYFITPEDPIIKYFTQKIQEKILKGESAVVDNKPEEAVRFLAGIYDATYVSHMVYSGTSGVPESINGVVSTTQSLRLPREVVTGKTGLCIELSILYASIMMTAGLDPVIFLIPGHAYPGLKVNGQYFALEATGIGGEGMGGRMTTEQALKRGMQELEEFMKAAQTGDDRYQILDVREVIKNGTIAMELKDDPYLRQKVDEIAQSFDGNAAMNTVAVQPNTTTEMSGNNGSGGNNGGNSGSGIPSGYRSFNGAVSFVYPGSWRSQPPSTPLPQLKKVFVDPSGNAYLEVYQFPGIQSADQAIRIVQQSVQSIGGYLQYSPSGQSGNFSVIRGQSGLGGSSIDWVAAFKPANGGMAGIAVGTVSGAGGGFQNSIQNILNSLR